MSSTSATAVSVSEDANCNADAVGSVPDSVGTDTGIIGDAVAVTSGAAMFMSVLGSRYATGWATVWPVSRGRSEARVNVPEYDLTLWAVARAGSKCSRPETIRPERGYRLRS